MNRKLGIFLWCLFLSLSSFFALLVAVDVVVDGLVFHASLYQTVNHLFLLTW